MKRSFATAGALTSAVVAVAGVTAAALVNSNLSMGAGDNVSVACGGPSVVWSQSNATAGQLACATNPTTTPPTTTTAPGGPSWWQPGSAPLEWQWELGHPLSLSSATDMGTGQTAWNGNTAPATNPSVYDIDAIENPASTVAALHAKGFKAICYIEVGTVGNYYSAADEGVSTTYYQQFANAGVLGKKLSGYPEYFLNIKAPATVSILKSMIQKQCAGKGFDAVETDLDETYSGSDGSTGFTLTQSDEVNFMSSLSDYMHGLGLAWVIKNPADTGDNFASVMYSHADLVLEEQCRAYNECAALNSYVGHKPILDAEYGVSLGSFCPADNATTSYDGVLFPSSLDGSRHPCR